MVVIVVIVLVIFMITLSYPLVAAWIIGALVVFAIAYVAYDAIL